MQQWIFDIQEKKKKKKKNNDLFCISAYGELIFINQQKYFCFIFKALIAVIQLCIGIFFQHFIFRIN